VSDYLRKQKARKTSANLKSKTSSKEGV